ASKISGTVWPMCRSTHSSLSRYGQPSRPATTRPTVLLPTPIMPINKTRVGRCSQVIAETVRVAHELGHRIAAELPQCFVGQRQRHHGLGDHAHGGYCDDVGALLERHDLL